MRGHLWRVRWVLICAGLAMSCLTGGTALAGEYLFADDLMFRITQGTYAETSDWTEAVQNEFGDAWEVADWALLKARFGSTYDDALRLAQFLGPRGEENSAYVTRDGAKVYSGARHYYATPWYQDKGSWYYAHDNMQDQMVSLGSWFNIDFPVLACRSLSTPAQVCYLDFSSYTAPSGYGTAEQIAADVKASVSSKYTQHNLTFYTSFDSYTPDPSITSTVIVGGTNATATKLGYAPYDSGNANRTDTGYVYSDQPLFSTLPTNSTEYTNMLSNTTAHEVGHLLGYEHADSMGMPYMSNGSAMEAVITQDLQEGALGRYRQTAATYVADTDVNALAARIAAVYAIRDVTMPAVEFAQALEEMQDRFAVDITTAGQILHVCADVHGLASVVAELYAAGAGFGGLITSIAPVGLVDDMMKATAGVSLYDEEGPDFLDIASMGATALNPIWDDAAGAFVLTIDGEEIEAFLDSRLELLLLSEQPGVNRLEFTFYDENYQVIDTAYVQLGAIPEPSPVCLVVVASVPLLLLARKGKATA